MSALPGRPTLNLVAVSLFNYVAAKPLSHDALVAACAVALGFLPEDVLRAAWMDRRLDVRWNSSAPYVVLAGDAGDTIEPLPAAAHFVDVPLDQLSAPYVTADVQDDASLDVGETDAQWMDRVQAEEIAHWHKKARKLKKKLKRERSKHAETYTLHMDGLEVLCDELRYMLSKSRGDD